MSGVLAAVGRFLFGGGGQAVVNVAKGVDDIVDRHVATVENKEAFTTEVLGLVQREQQTAAAFAAPGVHNTAFDALVDGINRLVRPVIAIAVLGAWFGWWRLVPIDTLGAEYQFYVRLVVTFYFGGRVLTKDVPQAIVYTWTRIFGGKR